MTTAGRDRGRRTRDELVAAATALFHERGYHATGIDDIGEAAGVTGPAVYRHFASKADLLVAVFDAVWDLLRPAMLEAGDLAACDALDLLLTTQIGLALDHRAAVVLVMRELRHLPEGPRRIVRDRDARWIGAWARVIAELRGVPVDEARAAARAVTTLVASAALGLPGGRLERDRHARLLDAMARGAIDAVGAPR